jgi:predicted nucleic acid-binding protein
MNISVAAAGDLTMVTADKKMIRAAERLSVKSLLLD